MVGQDQFSFARCEEWSLSSVHLCPSLRMSCGHYLSSLPQISFLTKGSSSSLPIGIIVSTKKLKRANSTSVLCPATHQMLNVPETGVRESLED